MPQNKDDDSDPPDSIPVRISRPFDTLPPRAKGALMRELGAINKELAAQDKRVSVLETRTSPEGVIAYRLNEVEKRLTALEGDAEATGRHEIQALRDDKTWSKRQMWIAITTLSIACLAGLVGLLIALLRK